MPLSSQAMAISTPNTNDVIADVSDCESLTCISEVIAARENKLEKEIMEMAKKLKRERRFNELLLQLIQSQPGSIQHLT